MSPHAVLISDNDLSNAFHDQFSTIIRLESRLQGDHSEDVTGPAHQLWVVRHLTEVAHAQRITSQLPAQMMTANVHAPEFITPSHARVATASRSQHITPWYDNFFLADQRITDSSSPNRYNLFDPAELATCPTATRAQLRESSDQNVRNQYNATIGRVDSTTYSVHGSTSRRPSTPPNTFPRAQYPSTPPNQSSRHHHRRRTSQLDFLPDLTANRSYTTVRASTEPTAESRMGSLAAPDHYQPFEVRALDVQIGDHIQSVQNPGEVTDHYPYDDPAHPPIGDNEARPLSPNGGLCIQFTGADGTVGSQVFRGLDRVQVLREVANEATEED